jgi:pyruvate/2-oxoglutarate dehydrogenase complex dihydrolipoamide acyltransferase (E2) component
MSDAVDLMLGVFRSPGRSAMLRTRELPDGVLDVIRIAAGDEQAIAAARASTALDPADLGTAASLLLRNLFFFEGADSYRTLGVRPDADPAQIKRHYRWLVRWLHPDRNPESMHGVFVDRINRAWNSIRTPERRSRYDLDRRATQDADASVRIVDTASRLREWSERSPMPLLSARIVRRLPAIILFGTGFIAMAVFCLAIWIASVDTDSLPIALPASDVTPPPSAEPAATPPPAIPTLPSSVPPAAIASPPSAPAPLPAKPVSANLRPRDTAAPPAAVAVPPQARPGTTVASESVMAARDSSRGATVSRPDGRPAPAPAPALAQELNPPVLAPTPAPPTAQARAPLSGGDLREFVERFQRLYASDDVEHFLALFSTEVNSNDSGYAGLASDYRRLFDQRRLRRLNLSDLRWEIDGDRAAGTGRYEAWVGPSADKPERHTRGQIMLQLTDGEGGVRITRLDHTVID